ncbi:hypothetical protein [Prescottella equi]|uniref:hypothetical protein n=1 Tax=Rhodococcus hoagii TaxID=43767 RepID=UPI001EEBC91A|nr:hypothetical protein [Prescottella equi]
MDQLTTLIDKAEHAEREADFYHRHNLHDRANAANRNWIHMIHAAAAERARLQRAGHAA